MSNKDIEYNRRYDSLSELTVDELVKKVISLEDKVKELEPYKKEHDDNETAELYDLSFGSHGDWES